MSFVLKRFFKYIFYAIAALALLAAGFVAYLTWFQPPFYFPKPTGPYAVGVREYHWFDATRKEIYSDDPAHPNRELMVKIWYPAMRQLSEKPSTPYAPYLVECLKKKSGWFDRLIWRSRPIYSYAVLEALIAQDVPHFPVLIFSHGFGTAKDEQTAQCENLASHGYLVVGISHTYTCCVVQFPDNRIVDCAKCDAQIENEGFEKIGEQQIDVWAADVSFALTQLERLADDPKSPFYQRIDKERVGALGHSFGGATAIQVCRHDPRVKAGVDMDGSLYGLGEDDPVNKPVMFMLAEHSVKASGKTIPSNYWKKLGIKSVAEAEKIQSRYLPAFEKIARAADSDAHAFIIKHVAHMDFTDLTLFKHAPLLVRLLGNNGMGSLNGFRVTEIVNAYLVSFFNKYLKNQPSELLDGGERSKYPEVVTKQWEEKTFKK